MRRLVVGLAAAALTALLAAIAGCGGGGGGGGGGEPVKNVSGTWQVRSIQNQSDDPKNCPSENHTWNATITQPEGSDQLSIARNDNGHTFVGAIQGNTMTWSGSYADDEGTTSEEVTGTVSADGNTFTGTGTWSWSGGGLSCNGTREIEASRIATPAPASSLVLSPATVAVSGTAGGADPAPQEVAISSSGDELSGLTATIAYGSSGSGWLAATLGTTETPATLNLQASAKGLAAGTYTAKVSIAATGADNSPQTLEVGFSLAPPTKGSLRVTTSLSGANQQPSAYALHVSPRDGLTTSTEISAPGQRTFSGLPPGPCTVELLIHDPDRTVVNGNPRTVAVVAGTTVEVAFQIEYRPRRQITIIDDASPGLSLSQVVQVKVSTTGTFTNDDLLTDDPAACLAAPGDSIPAGSSKTFTVDQGNDYYAFIGMGVWIKSGQCSVYYPYSKATAYLDRNQRSWYVWAAIKVTDHASGNWNWTIEGSYLDGTLRLIPAGGSAIAFHVTSQKPF